MSSEDKDYVIELTQDRELVKSILTDPDLYKLISDDFSPLAKDFEPIWDDSRIHLLVKKEDKVIGVTIGHFISGCCMVGHFNILPKYWGDNKDANRACIDWVFENTNAIKCIAFIPEYCKEVLKSALSMGCYEEGYIANSILKDGKLYGQWLVGIDSE